MGRSAPSRHLVTTKLADTSSVRTVENSSGWCAVNDNALSLHQCPAEQNPVIWPSQVHAEVGFSYHVNDLSLVKSTHILSFP